MKILFVCSSNICRSPYAEIMFRQMVKNNKILSEHIESINSTAVFNKSKKLFGMTKVSLLNEGISNDEIDKFKPTFKRTEKTLLEEADIIIGMDNIQKWFTPRKYRKKYQTLSEVSIGKKILIPDPFLRKNQEDYNNIMKVIKVFLGVYATNLADEFEIDEQKTKI